MPFEIVRNDITNMVVDAIVNTANPQPVVGQGTDSRIHSKAGPELLQARQVVGPIRTGCAAVTPAFLLRAKYVIHTVGPVWDGGGYGEEESLRSCYDAALQLALEKGCHSIAFPLISSGNYGFPKDKALQIAIAAFSAFLTEHEMQIYLTVFDRDAFRLSEKLFSHVASYIDQHYVDAREIEACAIETCEEIREDATFRLPRRRNARSEEMLRQASRPLPSISATKATPKASTLEEALKAADIGFSEALLQLIDKTGKKDSEIYKKANLSKQHFSKIRNNPDYKPTKATALALALALELDLEQTKELIGRAGYALTNSSKFDLIIRFFIEQKNFNIVEINIALYEFDQTLLGA